LRPFGEGLIPIFGHRVGLQMRHYQEQNFTIFQPKRVLIELEMSAIDKIASRKLPFICDAMVDPMTFMKS